MSVVAAISTGSPFSSFPPSVPHSANNLFSTYRLRTVQFIDQKVKRPGVEPRAVVLCLALLLSQCTDFGDTCEQRTGGIERPSRAIVSHDQNDTSRVHQFGHRVNDLSLAAISERVLTGSQPEERDNFVHLHHLNIQTIVSVDGASPDVEAARKLGMRYIHLPIGYDSVPKEIQAALAKVLATTEGKIYIHCHHGKHRGPAAAAIAALLEGSCNKEQALEMMKKAGTGEEYAGLWKSVREFQPPAPDAPSAPLVEVAKVEPLAAAMVGIDKYFDDLTAAASGGWKQDNEEVAKGFAEQSVLLMEGFRESARFSTGTKQPEEFAKALQNSEGIARSLNDALKKRRWDAASEQLQRLKADCRACHKTFRN